MRKLGIFLIGALLSFAFLFGGYNGITAAAESQTVYVGGMSAGFTLKTGSVQVIGMCEVISENGVYSPALDAGLRAGDIISKVGEISVETVGELNEIVNNSKGKSLKITAERGEERLNFSVQPTQDKLAGRYRIGVLVRDNVSGIGTVTFINKNSGRFGALGHTVTGEKNKTMRISDGSVYECNIIGVAKGVRGRAGELKGMFLNDKAFGKAEKLCNCGIFGQISEEFDTKYLHLVEATSIDAKPGKAYIYSTIDGICPKKYEIEIIKVDKNNKENKNYVIHVLDDALIEETGGIVQGMSGSPILQENKLIGAVTHVFLNDPTRGYGIDIETMLEQ